MNKKVFAAIFVTVLAITISGCRDSCVPLLTGIPSNAHSSFWVGQTVYFNPKTMSTKGVFDNKGKLKEDFFPQLTEGRLMDITYSGRKVAKVEIWFTPRFSTVGFTTLNADVLVAVPEQGVLVLKR